jgi:hypothetical protein
MGWKIICLEGIPAKPVLAIVCQCLDLPFNTLLISIHIIIAFSFELHTVSCHMKK